MRELYEQAHQLVEDVENIAANLFALNPGLKNLKQGKILCETIQYDVATLMRNLSGLYADLGKEIKEDQVEKIDSQTKTI